MILKPYRVRGVKPNVPGFVVLRIPVYYRRDTMCNHLDPEQRIYKVYVRILKNYVLVFAVLGTTRFTKRI